MADRDNRAIVLILGMHRSGTSVLTSALAETGARLPSKLLLPQADNPDGFFESAAIIRLHDEILAEADSSWDDPTPWTLSKLATLRRPEFRHRLWEVLREDMPGSGPLLVKDPRLCRLLPVWQDLAEERGLEIRYVLVVRHPMEVAASLAKRNGMAMKLALSLWLRSYLDAEHATRGSARLVAHYDTFLREKSRFILPLAAALGVACRRPPEEIRRLIDKKLHEDRRHFMAPASDMSLFDTVPETVRSMYEWLLTGLHPSLAPPNCAGPINDDEVRSIEQGYLSDA